MGVNRLWGRGLAGRENQGIGLEPLHPTTHQVGFKDGSPNVFTVSLRAEPSS